MKLVALLVLPFLLLGCGTHFKIYVDSINSGSTTNNLEYFIASGMKGIYESDLQFKEFSDYVVKSLKSRGYKVTKNLEDAEAIVLLSYAISDPKEFTKSVPIFGQTGISSSTTYGTISSLGSGSSTFSGTTNYTPSYGITGYAPITRINYTRQIKLVAIDWATYKNNDKEKILWQTNVISTGTSGDLRRVFPVMIAAATPYIGNNTEKQVKVVLKENNKKVKIIKGILEE
ncbi:hypothetical protein [Sedimentisphaera salicampi]|uniref:hypothetical protein n=1 Tax=Sedimentisphaera salicampi TaxID=1941349 RepID=UPI000B9B0D33|nr:hypothetical protein [Sedimentisphaera salicampi]OXU14851.1 hypothetical protein SMSP1_01346 [Sedimentisphaera salicampi]